MQELHTTLMGRRLIEHDIPEIHQQLKRIADALEILTKPKEPKVKEEKIKKPKSPFELTMNGPGLYQLKAYEDRWDVYQDKHSYTKGWRGEFISGPVKRVAGFKMNTKKEVLNCIYQLYGPTTNSSGVSGADRSGDNR